MNPNDVQNPFYQDQAYPGAQQNQPVQSNHAVQPVQTLPASVQHHMANAQQMLARQDQVSAHSAMMQATNTLAQSAPEYGALMVAAAMGYRQINAVLSET
ncbi:MAG: hypothetical protein ABUL72_06615, partial [Armatimonadota bacterium]